MAINGNSILIYRDDELIAGTRSNEIQTASEMIEVSSPASGRWREYRDGRKEWSVTTNYLVGVVGSTIKDLLTVGTRYNLTFKNRDQLGGLYGNARLKLCRITATRGNLAQGSFQFTGDGELKEIVNLIPLTSGWQNASGGDATYDASEYKVKSSSTSLYMPKIWLEAGQSVCFSTGNNTLSTLYVIVCTSPSEYRVLAYYERFGTTSYPSVMTTTTPDGQTRYYITFTQNVSGYMTICLPTNDWVIKPQLEAGTTPTNFSEH